MQALGAVPPSIGLLALALLGAMLGFAPFNKHPAKMFLGDAGSLPIGLLLAFMLIYVAGADLAAAVLLALYTIADSTITLIRRAYNREHVFSAHRSHFYQRAVIAGMTPPQVTARVFILGLLLAGLAVAAAIAQSTIADILLLASGAAATGFVLSNLARGRQMNAPKRRVLITGASGFIGKPMVRALAASGWAVRAASRDPAAIPDMAGVERVALPDLARAGGLGDRSSRARPMFCILPASRTRRANSPTRSMPASTAMPSASWRRPRADASSAWC